MKSLIKIFLLLGNCVTSYMSMAQFDFRSNNMQPNNEIKSIFAKINDNKILSYESDIISYFPDGTVDSVKTFTAMDILNKWSYQKNKFQETVINDNMYFKIDHIAEGISLFDLVKYSQKYPMLAVDINEFFSQKSNDAFLDSTVYKYGKIASKEIDQQFRVYNITFPPNYFIVSYEIKVNMANYVPEYIILKFVEPTMAFFSTFSFGVTSYQVTYYNYSTQVSPDLFDISKYERAYITSNQFKNYEIFKI